MKRTGFESRRHPKNYSLMDKTLVYDTRNVGSSPTNSTKIKTTQNDCVEEQHLCCVKRKRSLKY